MSQPAIGCMVHTRAPLGVYNGAETVPAVITRVWTQTTLAGLDVWVVNLRIFHDGPETVWRTTVYLFDDEAAARSLPGFNAW